MFKGKQQGLKLLLVFPNTCCLLERENAGEVFPYVWARISSTIGFRALPVSNMSDVFLPIITMQALLLVSTPLWSLTFQPLSSGLWRNITMFKKPMWWDHLHRHQFLILKLLTPLTVFVLLLLEYINHRLFHQRLTTFFPTTCWYLTKVLRTSSIFWDKDIEVPRLLNIFRWLEFLLHVIYLWLHSCYRHHTRRKDGLWYQMLELAVKKQKM